MPGQTERFKVEYSRLSDRDRYCLENSAACQSVGTGLDPTELFDEAVGRILSERRNWPEHVPLLPFVIQVMRGIAFDERRRRAREPSEGAFGHQPGGGRAGVVLVRLDEFPSADPSPEDLVFRGQLRTTMFALFKTRPVETEILKRMFEGLEDDDLRGDLPAKTFETGCRNIRRATKRLSALWS